MATSTRALFPFLILLIAAGFTLAGCEKKDGEDEKKAASAAQARQGLASIGDGAIVYFQEEHASPDGMTVTTRVFPDVSTQACGNAHDFWKDLRFEPEGDVEYCYVSAGGGKVFAAAAKEGDTVLCIRGKDAGGTPELDEIEEVDAMGDCKP